MRTPDIMLGLEWWMPLLRLTEGLSLPSVTARCPPFVSRVAPLFYSKPNTFMNLGGKAVKHWMTAEKIPADRILVVTDDLHLDFETIRLRAKGADGGHNGLKDIQSVLGTTVYPRLKVGIGADFSRGQQSDFVLGEWTSQEELALQEVLTKSAKAVEALVSIGLSRAMNQYN